MNGCNRLLQIVALTCIALCLITGCHPKSYLLEPSIQYYPQERLLQSLPTAFPPLTAKERKTEWGKELEIATRFARELDLYRAITSFKRAQMLAPRSELDRRQQISYGIVASYYLGKKYWEALREFENSELAEISSTFPAVEDLIIILYDSYRETCQPEKADGVMHLINKASPETAQNLQLSNAILEANLPCINQLSRDHPCCQNVQTFLCDFCRCKKSIRTAQTLNAILPGAGYLYVGQCRSAITSFVINGLFTWAAYRFFEKKQIPAGIITASIELGWYFGGINGAGLEAKEYNERLYENLGKETMIQCGLFPVLMFQTTF